MYIYIFIYMCVCYEAIVMCTRQQLQLRRWGTSVQAESAYLKCNPQLSCQLWYYSREFYTGQMGRKQQNSLIAANSWQRMSPKSHSKIFHNCNEQGLNCGWNNSMKMFYRETIVVLERIQRNILGIRKFFWDNFRVFVEGTPVKFLENNGRLI